MRGLFSNSRYSLIWLIVRIWLGWQWFVPGLEKVRSPAWTGAQAGTAVSGFLQGAVAKATGEHPAVLGSYAAFVKNVALPNATLFSYLVAYGEFLVGCALILGALTTFAAVMAAFLNLNYMLAGSASMNPVMYTVAILLVLAGANAGRIGLDHYILPPLRRALGLPARRQTEH